MNNLEEKSFSRVLSHLENKDVAIISASRSERDRKDNLLATKNLAQDLRRLGYGFIPVKGGYIENKDTPNEVSVEEESFMVINNNNTKDKSVLRFKYDMIGLCRKYEQESVLIRHSGKSPAYYDQKGKMVGKPFGAFNVDAVNQYFTKAHGHAFEFVTLDEARAEYEQPAKSDFSKLLGELCRESFKYT